MSDNINDWKSKLRSGSVGTAGSVAVDYDAQTNIGSRAYQSISTSEVVDYDKLQKEEAKKEVIKLNKELKEANYTPDDIVEIKKSEDFWHQVFETTKKTIKNSPFGGLLNAVELGTSAGAAISGTDVNAASPQTRSVKEISQEYIDASNRKKLFDRVKQNGIVIQTDGSKTRLEDELPYMEDISIFDRIFNSVSINENKLGNKKFSINWTPTSFEDFAEAAKEGKTDASKAGVYQYYFTKDEDGNDVLGKARFNNVDQLRKAGNIFLNNFGPVPVKSGFSREFSAGLGNAGRGLVRSLLNIGEGAYTLANEAITKGGLNTKQDDINIKRVNKFADDYRANDDLDNYDPGKGGTAAWLGGGIGQGAASLAQFAVTGAAAKGIGALVSRSLSVAGKLDNLTTFGAGAVMNFGEAYESALNAGLSKQDASKVGMLTGAINGIIESAVGTNKLTNWLSGGGNRVLAQRVLADLGGDASETSLKRVLNTWQKQASGRINQLFNTPILGSALEEGIEEFSQTMTQKTVENLYDAFISDSKEVGKDKFGTQAISKHSIMEALEAGFFGAILGGGMGGIKHTKEQYDKYVNKKTSHDEPILKYLADGNKSQVLAMVDTLFSTGVINDNQKTFYTQKINNLAELVDKNQGKFAALDQYGPEVATKVKAQALNVINGIASLDQELEVLAKKEQTPEIIKEIKTKAAERTFYSNYLETEFLPREDGKVNAVEFTNYLNQEEVLNNKFNRFQIDNDITSTESSISNYESKAQQNQEDLDNIRAKKGKAAKEIKKELDLNKLIKSVYENKLKQLQELSQKKVDEFNEITSDTYQADLKDKADKTETEDTAPKGPTETSAPVDIQEGIEDNSDVQLDNEEKLTYIGDQLLSERDEILNELENPDLDSETKAELELLLQEIDNEVATVDNKLQIATQDYKNQVSEIVEKLDAFNDLEDVELNQAYSAIKKEIEQLIPAYRDQGLDVSELQSLHTTVTKIVLETRDKLESQANDVIAQEEFDNNAADRDNEPLVKGINFFDRVERLRFMNNHKDYWSDEEFDKIFLNTPIEEILSQLEMVYYTANDLGIVAGAVVGKWNNGTNIVNPKIVISLSYQGKNLGNLNQLDSFTVTDPSQVNLSEQGLLNTQTRNIKLIALLKEKGRLDAETLKSIGFNLSWNGDFFVDTNIGRTLIKDFPAAKLVGKSGKSFYYIYDSVNSLEITNLFSDPNNELDNIPAIPEGLKERYVVLVRANNGKLYWVGSQNQVNTDIQDTLYSYLFEQVEKLKTIEDPAQFKKLVGDINRYLENNIFVATNDPTKQNSQLQLTTPTQTSKSTQTSKFYGLRLKGSRKKVHLDNVKYSNLNDLLAGLELTGINLRTPLVNNASVETTINTLSINLKPTVLKNPSVSIKIDEDKLDSLLVNNPVEETEIVEFADAVVTEEVTTPDIINNTISDLSSFDSEFNNLSKEIKLEITNKAQPLLDQLTTASKIKKAGIAVKIRAIINEYKGPSSDPVFSIGTSEEIMDYNEAVNWINKNLPDTISIDDINKLLGDIKNNGITFGAFANSVIYLSTKAAKGTEYHEAFHAIFRLFSTDKQIQAAYNIISRTNKPTKKDLEDLRNSSSVYINYNDTQLRELFLEEKLADNFKEYSKDFNTNNPLKSIWNKIINWINFITGNMDEVQALFYNINRGKFKNALITNNKFTNNINESVFQIYKKGIDEINKTTIVTSQLEGQAVLANLTRKLLQLKINKAYPNLTDDKIIDILLAEKAAFYSLDDNAYYELFLDEKGLSDNDEYIEVMTRNLEQKRNIYTLPENIAALKKDIKSKISIFDIDTDIDNENRQKEIDDVGENFDTDPWSIGGETSFSKVLREYISLVVIKTKDEYGQDIDEAVDFSKVYRGLVRALAGIEEDKVLPRFKALAEFDEDINAVFNQLILDLGLTNDSLLDGQNITKNYDLWRKFVTAFNNENVSWYTILQSNEQSRLLETNNNSAKDIQFNSWLQNYNISFEDGKFDEDVKKSINAAADAVNRSENAIVNSLAEAKKLSSEIREHFKKLSIILSDGYITYSLLKKSPYLGLDQEAKDLINAFSGVEGLYDGGNIPFIVTEFKSEYNPFITTKDDKNKERGAVSRLKNIAQQNALFDPTIGESSFQNADGKSVYSIIRPSFGLVKLRWLRNTITRNKLLRDEKNKKDDFIDPLENVVLNHLLGHENLDIIMSNLTPSMIDGYRITSIEGDIGQTEEGEGITFGKFNSQEYLLADMLMFLSNRKVLSTIDEQTGKTIKLGESAMINIDQMEASNTGYAVFLPVEEYNDVNDNVTDILFNYLAQEVIRINKVKKQFGKEGTTIWNGYNDKLGARGFKLMEFAGYDLDGYIDDITSKDNVITPEDVYSELLYEKDKIVQLIKIKLEKDIQDYTDILNANNVLSLLPNVELLKRNYLTEGKSEMTPAQISKLVNNQYLNAYINTLGINNLLLDNYSKKVKNTVDWFKRAKGIIGSGADMGTGTTRVGVYKEPLKYIDVKNLSELERDKLIEEERLRLEDGSLNDKAKAKSLNTFIKQIDKGKIQIADAQSYVTLDHKILQLQRWGRFPKQVSDIYDKLKLGEEITWDEKNTLEDNNAALNSTKTVSYNGDFYFKLSEIALSPRLVGKTDESENVILDDQGRPAEAKEGFEYLFNKYISMLDQGVDQALPESASKMATISPAEYAQDGKFDFTGSVMELENKFKRLQVETPSGKRSIIHGTQLIQLVHSEQSDNLEIDFKYNSDIKTVGQLRELYRGLLADNRLEGFKTALAYMRDPISGEVNSKELTKKFYQTITESGSDEVLSNFFSPDPITGERQFNWNLGPIVNKAEQLFLSHFSKGVLSQKVPGLKVSLVSDAGILVKDAKTGKMRSLAHMQLDDDGNYYSECLLPPFAEELLGKNPSDADVQKVLKMFGVRIPTQDKHSMISLKVVGFLPMEYGSVGIFPKEIVYLSGADFDIDSEFIHTPDFYVEDNGRIRLYGEASTDENKYQEYITWNLKNNKLLKNRINTLGSLEAALSSLNMPTTALEFIVNNTINVGLNNNLMLEAQIKFLTNDYVRERAAIIPSSLSSIKDVADIVMEALNIDQNQSISPNTPLARYNANRNNMEGKDGIGPVALSNVTHALLSTYDQKLFSEVSLPTINGKLANGFGGIYTIDSDSNRKNDNISTLLSAMTDNAKEQLAKLLTLTFNSRTADANTLPVAAYMLSVGYSMEETVLFINQPTIRAFITNDQNIYKKLEELQTELEVHLGVSKNKKDAYKLAYQKFSAQNIKPFTSENLISSLNENDLDIYDLPHIRLAESIFNQMQLQAGYNSNVSALMSLNKGVKSTFDDNLRLETVLDSLQLNFLYTFINDDVLTYDDLITKLLEENYIRVVGNKIYKDINMPVFETDDNINKTPFDARETLLNDPNTIQNIIIYKKIMDTSKEFFLMNTPVFKKLRGLVNTNSKNLIPYFMNKANEAYLETNFPEKYQELITAKDNAAYMIHKSGNNSIGRDLFKLKKDPDFRNNLLIKMLSLKQPSSSSKVISIEFPTRIKAQGDFYTNVNNAFKELFMNPKTTDFARKLYYYSYYKDGLQFKNKSFINTIPSWVFRDVSKSLDNLNNDFKDTNYESYTSLSSNLTNNIIDMLTSLAVLENHHDKLQYIGIHPDIKANLKITDNEKHINYVIKFDILKQIDITSAASFEASLKELHKITGDNKLVALSKKGIPYNLAVYEGATNPVTQETVTRGRLIESVKAFIGNGELKTLTLEELVDFYMDKGFLPKAIEVNYSKVRVIEDTAFDSTITDVQFINSYSRVVKNIDKEKQIYNDNEPKVSIVPDTNENLDNTENDVNYQKNQTSSDAGILASEQTVRDLAATISDRIGFDVDELPFQKVQNLLENSENNSIFDDIYISMQKAIDDSFDKEDKLNKLDSDVDNFTDDSNNPLC